MVAVPVQIPVTRPPRGRYWITVTVAAFEVTPPLLAVTVEVPIATAVANPVEDMLAAELGLEVHVEVAVTSPIEPSL